MKLSRVLWGAAALGIMLPISANSAVEKRPNSDAESIRAIETRRQSSNEAIAARDATGAAAHLETDAMVIASGGAVIRGREKMRAAFETVFRNDAFVTYLRNPGVIEISADGATAAEQGRWTGVWSAPCGARLSSGVYQARWDYREGVWAARSEHYVKLNEIAADENCAEDAP